MNDVTKRAEKLYNEIRFGDFSYEEQRVRYDELLHTFLKRVKTGNLYDIGCGSGSYFKTYQTFGIAKGNIIAVDLAPANIARLQKQGFHALRADIFNLPFENNVADFTIANGVIHHTSDPLQAFRELVRITKPGGSIYLNVYNQWHPYYYIVHKATLPLRYIYHHWTKKIFTIAYPLSKLIFQPLALLLLGQFIDDKTGKALFKDQVLTPRAYLFSKAKLQTYARAYNCTIEQFAYNRYYMMLAAIIKVNK